MTFTLLSYLSFYGKSGPQLIDALDLTKLSNYTLGSQRGVVAQAGGAQAGSPLLEYGLNELTTVVTTNDSSQMPPALPGAFIKVNNQGASTARIFAGIAPNLANAGVLDQLIAVTTVSKTANGTALTLATGHCTEFICTTIGVWKQTYDV